MLDIVNLPRDVRYVTFSFINLNEMIYCSQVNRSWKVLSLESAIAIHQFRYQHVIINICKVLEENMHLLEAERLKVIQFTHFPLFISFSFLNSGCIRVQAKMRQALFNAIKVKKGEKSSRGMLLLFKNIKKASDRNLYRLNLSEFLSKICLSFINQCRLNEALIVAKLMPSKLLSFQKVIQTGKSQCLQKICFAYIARQEIPRVLKIAACISDRAYRNKVYFRVVKFWIKKEQLEKAYEVAQFIKTQNVKNKVFNGKFMAYEELARAYYHRGNKKDAIIIKNLIPDNDPDGCKKRLNKAFTSKCIIS